jgi:hypothetical protein
VYSIHCTKLQNPPSPFLGCALTSCVQHSSRSFVSPVEVKNLTQSTNAVTSVRFEISIFPFYTLCAERANVPRTGVIRLNSWVDSGLVFVCLVTPAALLFSG